MIEKEKLNNRIKSLGLKKTFIANKIGITKVELSHLINGRREYREYRQRLLKFLGLNNK